MAYTILTPDITGVALAPNPVAFGDLVAVSLTITERNVVLEPVWYYCGEIFCGEA